MRSSTLNSRVYRISRTANGYRNARGQWAAATLSHGGRRPRSGVASRDLDLDGICELIVARPEQQAVYRFSGAAGNLFPWTLA